MLFGGDKVDEAPWTNEKSLRTYLDVATATAARVMHIAEPYADLLHDRTLVGAIFCTS